MRRLAASQRAGMSRVASMLAAVSATIALAATFVLATPVPEAGASVAPRVSLALIERQAMCVTCKVALNESQSPQANLERGYIRSLIYAGDSEAQIKRSLIAQYGPTVLGLPSAHGFDLAVYLVPLAVVLALIATVLALLLESDLARFD
jgi:cytochrome c-type biogenesis protein CcmH